MPGMLQPMGSQRVGHDLETEQQQPLTWCNINSTLPLWFSSPQIHNPTSIVIKVAVKSLIDTFVCVLSCLVTSNSCDAEDCSPPGSSVHGILQARILEWVVISSRGSSWPKDRTRNSCGSDIGRRISPNVPNWGTFYKIPDHFSSKLSKSLRQGKSGKEPVTSKKSLWIHKGHL